MTLRGQKRWCSSGGRGLERARAKSREKHLKKAAKSKDAYTIKVTVNHPDMVRSPIPIDSPQELCRQVNKLAAYGHPMSDYNKDGDKIGKIVRAFVTDIGEVWARVVPHESVQMKNLGDIW